MSVRAVVFLNFFFLLLSASSQEDAIAPWIPAKDALVTLPATAAGPAATYVQFLPFEVASGRRIPAIFLIKTPRVGDVVAYLTGVDGELGDDLLTMIKEGDKILREYLIFDLKFGQPSEKPKNSDLRHLPEPFNKLHLTGVHLPKGFLTLTELARFHVSKHLYPTGNIPIILVAERSDIFPVENGDESEEDVSEEESH